MVAPPCDHAYRHYIDDDGDSRCGECHRVVVPPSVRSIPTEDGGYDIVTDKYPDAQESPLNRFEDAEDVTELIHQVIGAGSMCWENLSGAGVFDSTEAAKIGSDAVARLSELGYIPMIARGEAKTRRKLE